MRRPLLLLATLPLVMSGVAPPGNAVGARPFAVTAVLSPAEVAPGGSAVLTGTLKPVRDAKVAIQLRDPGGVWTTVAKRPVDDRGRYRYPVTAGEPGSYDYRAKVRRVGRVDAGRSPVVTLTVPDVEVVEFTIPPGTHSADWNTEDTPLVAEVGQVLRVINADQVSHGILTTGAPFPDPGTTFGPGKSEDYLLTSSFSGALVCNVHPSSDFWVVVTEPAPE